VTTQVRKPQALNLQRPERDDIGRPARYWTFINRSSYYVFISMDWSESSILADPDHVVEPYTVQRVDFQTPADKITWQAAVDFPKANNPTGGAELFGYLASDTPLNAYPASVLTVGLTESLTVDLGGEGDVAKELFNQESAIIAEVVKLRQLANQYDRFTLDNLGTAKAGIGDAAPGPLWDFPNAKVMRLYKGLELRNQFTTSSGAPDNPNTAAWTWAGALWTDNTASSNLVDASSFVAGLALNEALYIGNDDPFTQLAVTMGTLGVAGLRAWEYWNGAAWVPLPDFDASPTGAGNFTASGSVSWQLPTDWLPRTLGGVQSLSPPDLTVRYWVRARVSTTYTTQPQVNAIRPPFSSQTVTLQPHIDFYAASGSRIASIGQDGIFRHAGTKLLNEPDGWQALPLSGAWAQIAAADAPMFRKNALGLVELAGDLTGGSTNRNQQIAQLPVGYRPVVNQVVVPASGKNATNTPINFVLKILFNGAIQFESDGGSNNALYLRSVWFEGA
jgi:hypothetical protein